MNVQHIIRYFQEFAKTSTKQWKREGRGYKLSGFSQNVIYVFLNKSLPFKGNCLSFCIVNLNFQFQTVLLSFLQTNWSQQLGNGS